MKFNIALAGNPNCGKTTMFNGLTGSSQYVGNWPGVTVEKKEGRLKGSKEIVIIDLPGIYSLSPYTLEEVVTRDYLVNEPPDVVVNMIDGTNLERNLYLTMQLAELGIPMIIAINMMDLVRKNGDKINIKKLEEKFGCKVVVTSALRGEGCTQAVEAAIALVSLDSLNHMDKKKKSKTQSYEFSKTVESAIDTIENQIKDKVDGRNRRWFAVKVFENDEKVMERLNLDSFRLIDIKNAVDKAEKVFDDDGESIITNERYEYISKVIDICVKKGRKGLTTSDKIDQVVTSRWFALPIFAAVMFMVYFVSVTTVGALVTDWTNDTLFGTWIGPSVQGFMAGINAAPWLTGLVVDGIIGGVGAVLGFVPQMLILFLFLSILEDCGYMARVAFIMDRVFRKFGLSGKSFIPMLISSGCGVPGIMATKTIENEKDRRMTIITATFIPCGAKLPVIALIGGAAMGGAWWMAPSMYFIGVGAVILSGIMLKKMRMFAGNPAPFVMELPQYHRPATNSVLIHMWERSRAFIIKAGTVIFIACGIIWFLQAFGWENGSWTMVENINNSMLASIGQGIGWVFAPLGFSDWKASMATITGLVAKENVIGTFGVLFGMPNATEADAGLWGSIMAIFPSTAAAMSFLIFNLLCAPCFAAMGAIKREMASGKWTAFAIGYQTIFAYAIALMVFQFGQFFAGGGVTMGFIVALITLAGMLYLLFRPAQREKGINRERVSA
ncbi:MAG: ferrous iron transport protein B [Anaerovoracaceae bacterium]